MVGAGVVLVFLAVLAGPARGAPFSLSYGGRLTAGDGGPVQGPVDVEVSFFGGATGGSPLRAALTFRKVPLASGVFQLDLGLSAADLQDLFGAGHDVWVEVTDATHGKTYPRQRYSAVPYALKVPVDGTSVVYDASGSLSVGAVDQGKVTGLGAALAGKADATQLTAGLAGKADVTQALTGDLGGTLAAPVVRRVQGTAVATTSPSTGQVLTFDGAAWVPATPSVGSPSAGANLTTLGSLGVGVVAPATAIDVVGAITDRGSAVVPGASVPGEGRLYFDQSSGRFLVSENGGAYGVVLSGTVGTAGTYAKVTTDAYGRVVSGGSLSAADLPPLSAGMVTSGTLATAQLPSVPVTMLAGTLTTAQLPAVPVGQLSGTLTAGQIPGLDASKIVSGTFAATQIPGLDASKVVGGTLAASAIPTLSAAQLTTGTLAVALGGTGGTSFTANGVLVGAGAGPLSATAAGSNYQVLTVSGGQPQFGAVDLGQSAAITGVLPVANGGTGASTLTANAVLLGNGTSAPTAVAPGTSGNVLTSNGTTWSSQAVPATNWASPGALGSLTPNTGAFTTLTASGNVGLGTTVLSNPLTIVRPTTTGFANVAVKILDGGVTYLGSNTTDSTSYLMANASSSAPWDAVVGIQGGNGPTGHLYFQTGHTIAATRMTIDGTGFVGIGTTSPLAVLDIEDAFGSSYAQYIMKTATITANTASNMVALGSNLTKTVNAGVADGGYVMAVAPTALVAGAGTLTNAYGVDLFSGTAPGSSASLGNAVGLQTIPILQGSGNISNAYGVKAHVANTGTGTIASAYGLYVDNPPNTGGGSITNVYGLYLQAQTSGASTNFSIYSAGGTNYLGGNLGLGATSPGTALDVAGAVSLRSLASAAVSPAGQGRLYFDTTTGRFKVSENGGAYADLAPTTATNGSAVLSASYTLTAANGTYEDTGLSITLPSAGTYQIGGRVRGGVNYSAGGSGFVVARLYNVTDSAVVTDSEVIPVFGTPAGGYQSMAPISQIVTVTGPKTIRLEAMRFGATTWVSANVYSDSNGKTTLNYVKLSN